MRFIDIAFTQPPEGWTEKAAAAEAAGTEKIGDHSDVWRCCKDKLKEASLQKCFYCEMKDSRSDGTVDHFRPKSKYTWAAFRFDNFRFACTFCNSRRTDKKSGSKGGKGDDFPLLEEDARATCQADECNELPLLLDPCDAGDPDLLDFVSDGSAVSRFDEDAEQVKQRAEISIRSYHLNHPDLVEARRCLAVTLQEKIAEAESAMGKLSRGDMDARVPFNSAVRDLKRAIAPNSELSVFAKRVLQNHKSKAMVGSVLATA